MNKEKEYPVYMEKESLGKRLSSGSYRSYILRELTGLFFTIYAVIYVMQFQALAAGRSAYQAFVTTLMSPPMVLLSIIIMFFSVYHTITWLYLNAWLSRNRWSDLNESPRQKVFLATIVLWLVVSVVIAYLIFLR